MITPTDKITPKEETSEARGSRAVASRIRLLVVDDHPAVRIGLRKLLDRADFVLVSITATAESAISIAERERIDLAVVDYHLGSRNGLWLSRKLKRLPDPPRVLIYSAYADGPLAAACVVAEADALVTKGGVGDELCHAIRSVARGRKLLPIIPQSMAIMMRRTLKPGDQAIFGMLLAGITPTAIAHTFGISPAELDSRLWSLLREIQELPRVGGVRRAHASTDVG
jgi:DNA-binding NarL/FixJ family response regulator